MPRPRFRLAAALLMPCGGVEVTRAVVVARRRAAAVSMRAGAAEAPGEDPPRCRSTRLVDSRGKRAEITICSWLVLREGPHKKR